jgi:hypothetical protein
MSYRFSRRAFLRGCGASTLMLPLLRNIEAHAEGKPAPLRFLVIHHSLGTQLGPPTGGPADLWRPPVQGTTTSFALPVNSAPFTPLQPKMVMIDGVNIVCASKSPSKEGTNTHEGGMVAIMTGQPNLGLAPNSQADFVAGGPSIDQIFLAQSPVLGGPMSSIRTPFQSLQLAADVRSDRDEVAPRTLSYGPLNVGAADIVSQRNPLAPETTPLLTYMRMFGGGMVTDPAQATAMLAQNKSVLDFMRSDMTRLRTLVPAGEAAKLDVYGESIRQLENSLSAGLTPGTCAQQPAPPAEIKNVNAGTGATVFNMQNLGAAGGSKLSGADFYDPTDPTNHPHQLLGQQQLQLMQAAFACDLARVGTFMWSAGTNWVVFPSPFQGAALANGATSSPEHPPSHTTDASTMSWIAQIDQWYAQQSATALQQFDASTDFDGNTLLDNTVVVYVSEVARAYDHDQRNVPFLVFGGKNTGINGGQFLKITGGPLIDTYQANNNRPTNDVWLALAPIFGVNLPSLGAANQWTGPLPGLVR